MSLFRDLEKSIDSKLKKLFASENAEAQGRELVEIQRAILTRRRGLFGFIDGRGRSLDLHRGAAYSVSPVPVGQS